MRNIRAILCFIGLFMLTAHAVQASCPYSTVQIRVQPDTSTPWSHSTTVQVGSHVHVGVFQNGWGVPVAPGTVTVYATEGSFSQPVQLTNGWEAWRSSNYPATWHFHAYCGGVYRESASATFTLIDVLSYVKPGGVNGVNFSVISDKGNPWRTFSKNNGNIGERLPGFFITKGNLDYSTYKAWNFEQMIYDSQWIYLVRDTSWTSRCFDNWREAGMLVFSLQNGQWVRGGRHFPRYIANGTSVNTGTKYIQGVEKKQNANDHGAQEGRWCNAQYSGSTYSVVRADLLTSHTVGNRTFNDVLKLSITEGSGAGDAWWFAKGYGLIRFGDGNQNERYSFIQNPYEIDVRIPCEPSAPCM